MKFLGSKNENTRPTPSSLTYEIVEYILRLSYITEVRPRKLWNYFQSQVKK